MLSYVASSRVRVSERSANLKKEQKKYLNHNVLKEFKM